MARLFLVVTVGALMGFALACGTKKGPCDGVTCPENQGCDPRDGVCKSFAPPEDAGVADAGSQGCTQTCDRANPVCDPDSHTCVRCIPTLGCGGQTPFCDTSVQGGRCIGCRDSNDCPSAKPDCNPATHTCQGRPGLDAGFFFSDSGYFLTDGGDCFVHDAGISHCTTECDRGFSCINDTCVLNGSDGGVQVTLAWDAPEDLDLHVVEPNSCEIYYGDPNDATTGPSSCGAVGSLDLDSNAGCGIDNVDIENVIYPITQPAPSGTYIVRVDYYENCSATTPVPFQVKVRANGQTVTYCDSFQPHEDDSGDVGSGRTIMSFTVP